MDPAGAQAVRATITSHAQLNQQAQYKAVKVQRAAHEVRETMMSQDQLNQQAQSKAEPTSPEQIRREAHVVRVTMM